MAPQGAAMPPGPFWQDPMGLRNLLWEGPSPRPNSFLPLGKKPRPSLLLLPGSALLFELPIVASPDPDFSHWPEPPRSFKDTPRAAAAPAVPPPGKHPLASPKSPPRKHPRTGGSAETAVVDAEPHFQVGDSIPRSGSLVFPSSTDDLHSFLWGCECPSPTPRLCPLLQASPTPPLPDTFQVGLLTPAAAGPLAPSLSFPQQQQCRGGRSLTVRQKGRRGAGRRLGGRRLMQMAARGAPGGERCACEVHDRAAAEAAAGGSRGRRQQANFSGTVRLAVAKASRRRLLLRWAGATAGAQRKATQDGGPCLAELALESESDQGLLGMLAPLARSWAAADSLPALLWSYIKGNLSPGSSDGEAGASPRQ